MPDTPEKESDDTPPGLLPDGSLNIVEDDDDIDLDIDLEDEDGDES